MLKAVIDKLEDVAEALRGFYSEKDGKWQLQVDGIRTQADIDRQQAGLVKERNDHIATKALLTAARETLAKFGEQKPEEVAAALEELATLKIGVTKDQAKVNQQIEERVEQRLQQRMGPIVRERDGFKGQVATLTTQVETFQKDGVNRKIGDALRTDAVKAGVHATALDDFIRLGVTEFSVDPTTGDVATQDGMRPSEWVAAQKKARPYLWPATIGAGAAGAGGGAAGEENPWSEAAWSITNQSKLIQTDKAEAERLAKAAGSKFGATRPTVRKVA